jgi:ethanolamine utilization microcompartment shell protein EutL
VQAASDNGKLLGEVLIDLGWADEQTIRRAVEAQVRDHQEARASVVGASRE